MVSDRKEILATSVNVSDMAHKRSGELTQPTGRIRLM